MYCSTGQIRYIFFTSSDYVCGSSLVREDVDDDISPHIFQEYSVMTEMVVETCFEVVPANDFLLYRGGGVPRCRHWTIPQSTQRAGPVRFLIFCSISFFPLATAKWQVGDPSVLLVPINRENLLQPAQAELVLGQPSTYVASWNHSFRETSKIKISHPNLILHLHRFLIYKLWVLANEVLENVQQSGLGLKLENFFQFRVNVELVLGKMVGFLAR